MSTESIAVQMERILDDYSQEVKDVTRSAMEETANEAVSMLKATSPKRVSKGGRRGKYARGWRVKKTGDLDCFVHNATDYQLTHLLENGHEVKPDPKHPGKKSRVNGIKHIKPVEEWCKTTFPVRISRGLK